MTAGDPQEMFSAYLKAFESLEPAAIVAFYDTPALVVMSTAVVPIPDAETGQKLIAASIQQLRAQGYERTEAAELEFQRLAPALATVSGVFIRHGESAELGRAGFTYTLRLTNGWKIVVAVTHDA